MDGAYWHRGIDFVFGRRRVAGISDHLFFDLHGFERH
jgi:hypothetical protein